MCNKNMRCKGPQNVNYFLCEKNTSEGIIGILAGRLKERFHKTTIFMSFGDICKGSIRAMDNFHCGDFIKMAIDAGHLILGGGHGPALLGGGGGRDHERVAATGGCAASSVVSWRSGRRSYAASLAWHLGWVVSLR